MLQIAAQPENILVCYYLKSAYFLQQRWWEKGQCTNAIQPCRQLVA